MNRRTIRRYAHEIYPHGEEGEIRDLAVEVPYLYARAIGLQTYGTSWMDGAKPGESGARTNDLCNARQIAFLADAMHQGLTGQEAWEWADMRSWDETGEWAWSRATLYGVPVYSIKPYPCGPEPLRHFHPGAWVDGKESECPDCTEEVDA